MAEVVTGEAVVLDVPFARFPSRAVALLLDLLIQIFLIFVFSIAVAAIGAGGALDPASGAAIDVTGFVLILVGYPVIWETTTRGRSPGKFALGLRVVSDDGSPERFRQALVRGLVSVVEIWTLFGLPALISSLVSARGKRLGDLFAGTLVIQQRLPADLSSAYLFVPPQLAPWAATLELSGLTEQTAETARRFLARWTQLRPQAREQLGAQLAAAVSAQVSPPPPAGTPAPVYLSAVLAERRRRDHYRWAQAGFVPPPPGAAWPPPPGAPWPAPPAAGPPAADAPPAWAALAGPTAPPPLPAPDVSPAPPDPPAAGAGGFVPPA